jgi:uncharacterized protein (TIGR00730 family)
MIVLQILTLIFMITCSAQQGVSKVHNIGIFCGTDDSIPDAFKEVAFDLSRSIAKMGHSLTTGGGNSGLMNAAIDGFTSEGDVKNTHAVIPYIFKAYNVHHPKIPEDNLIWTETIHERLRSFHEWCDIMVILPGGFGTLHELMDFIVPKQWGLTNKKIILLNTDHYWDYLLLQFKTMIEKNALKQKHLDLILVVTTIKECLDAINSLDSSSQHQGLEERYWEKNPD